MTKYLWLVTQKEITAWSTYVSAVVVAENEADAVRMLPTGRALRGKTYWCTPEYIQVKFLGMATPGLEGVICVSTQEYKGE